MASDVGANPPGDVDGAWRASVLQSYRNAEVREIAKVLAALEGQATTPASKLMLAMRFEDQIFKSAGSLADYRKRLTKRLKKLQKNYTPPAVAVPSSADAASQDARKRQELLLKLQQHYGETLRYIIRNAPAALLDIEAKLGPEKAEQLKQHTDSCLKWGRDLSVWTPEDDEKLSQDRGKAEKEAESQNDGTLKGEDDEADGEIEDAEKKDDTEITSKARETLSSASVESNPLTSSLSQLQRLEQHLEKRVENIRTYVAKHADPDLYLLETLVRKDAEVAKNAKANRLMAMNMAKRIQYLQSKNQREEGGGSAGSTGSSPAAASSRHDALVVLQRALDKAQTSVPPPTRSDSKQIEASLRHIDKMRAASTALMTYWTIQEDRVATAPRQTLQKLHAVVNEGVDFVCNVMKARRQEEEGKNTNDGEGHYLVSLQDAWAKALELPDQEFDGSATTDDGPPAKRLKTHSSKPVYKAMLVFHPNRKTPPALLDALKRKGAKLIQPPSRAVPGSAHSKSTSSINTSYLELDFGSAFTMTIYLSPLVAVLRAMPPQEAAQAAFASAPASSTASPDLDVSLANDHYPIVWKPLSIGLTGSSQSGNSSSTSMSSSATPRVLSVWGVSATYDAIGRVVEERLRDASTQATRVLRQCFQNHVKDKKIDFEVEILEGSALLEFLQIARRTYMPGWQDYDT